MAAEDKAGALEGSASLRKTISGGTLRKSGDFMLGRSSETAGSAGFGRSGDSHAALALTHGPAIPKYLSVEGLTRRQKLSKSTGNLHGYLAEDYQQINWPLPKMFGKETYGYSLIDITDPRHVKNCAGMSKKLVRLNYDQQIIDLEWRKTYSALLDAEHRQATLPTNAQNKTKDLLKKEVDGCMKSLLELQEQKDIYAREIQDVYAKCDDVKTSLKKESDLEGLRVYMEGRTRTSIPEDSPFWRTKFNIYRASANQSATSLAFR